jgi:hypothetical protein
MDWKNPISGILNLWFALAAIVLERAGGSSKLGGYESLKSCCLLTIIDNIVAAPKRLRRNAANAEQYASGRSQSAARCTDSRWTADRLCAGDSPV